MKNVVLSFFSLSLLIWSCQPNGTADDNEPLTVQLVCDELLMSDSEANFAISAVVEESKVKLAECPACQTISKEQYPKLGIPATAQGAIGGQVTGQWTIVYWQQMDNAVEFYLGAIDENATQEKYFSELARYEQGRYQISRPLHLADLAGYYLHQSADTSYVLFVGLRGPYLMGKLFFTAEPMPAQKVLQRALPSFATGPDTP
ncbi:MAG: hypothetical protein AAGJ82_16115, partial [Bacteroidota bacterium]